MATPRVPVEGQWTYEFLKDSCADPVVGALSCCLPCVQYGFTAETVHGGSCVEHGAKVCLLSYCCLAGTVAGPTRKVLRTAYKLPAQPAGLGADDPTTIINTDCLLYTLPCVGCFAMCQDANEVKARNIAVPLRAAPPLLSPLESAAQTTAPKQEVMTSAPKPATAEEPAVVQVVTEPTKPAAV